MKILLQRVNSANVKINGEIYSSINKGVLLFVSFTNSDNLSICEAMAKKLSKLRIFEDENGKTNISIKDATNEILSISQFTLYANLKNGNRPSFTDSLNYSEAKELYNYFNSLLIKDNFNVKEGVFGEDMKIELINDGPFTLILDSKELF